MDSASPNNGQPPTDGNNGTSTTVESMQKATPPTAPTQLISPHVAVVAAVANPVTEEQYALVMDPETQEPVELPTNTEDNTLLVSVLERAFPLAHGLRYKNPATGAMRVLKVNEEGTRFYPPTAAGWGNIVLTIVPKPAPAPMAKPTEPTKASTESKSKKDYAAAANKRKPAEIVASAASKKRGGITAQSGGGNSKGEVPVNAKEDAERLSTSPPAGKKRKSESVAEDERDEHEEEEEDGSVHLIDDDDNEVEELEEKEETAGANEVAKAKNEEGGAKRQRGKRGSRAVAWKAKQEAEAASAVASEKKCTDLIVLGLTHTTTEEEIRAYFEQHFGSVVMCELKMGSKGGSRGFGFIHMAKYADQEKVLRHPNHTIGGKIVEVQKSTPKGDRDVSPSVRSKKLFIGRLPDWMKTDRMRDFFFEEAKKIDPMVKIMDVYIPKPFRNFGFVTFNSARVVRELSRQIDFVIDGSSVSVSIAEPKASLAAKKGRVDDAPYMRPRSPERYGYGNNSRRSAYDDVPIRNSRFERYVEPVVELPMRGGGGRYGPEWGAMTMEDRYYAAMDQRGGGAQRALHQQRGSGPSGYASYQSALDVDEQRQVRQQMLAIQHQLQQQQTGGMARTSSPGAGYAGPERGGGGGPNPPMAHQLSAAIGDPSLANMNPEVVNAALKAFWSVARSGAPSSGQAGPSGSNSGGGGGGGSGGGHYPSEENWER